MPNDDIARLSDNSTDKFRLDNIDSYDDDAWEDLRKSLRSNNSLTKFSIYLPEQRRTFGETGILRILSALEEHPQLQDFELSLGYMPQSIVNGVANLIEKNKNIGVLGLPNNKLQNWHLDILSTAIKNNKNIDSIDFSKNLLKHDSIKMLKDIKNSRKMVKLDVSHNELGNNAIQLLLMPKLKENDDIEKGSIDFLDLSYNEINGNGILQLKRTLSKFQGVIIQSTSKLFLNGNPISFIGARTLSEIHEYGFEFDELHLSNTKITSKKSDMGIIELCKSIVRTVSSPSPIPIRVLNLEGIAIRVDGAKAIAELIEKNNSLEKITLSYNKINASDKLIISKALRCNTSIKEFDFIYDDLHHNYDPQNKISRNLVRNILDVFKENKVLEHIGFSRTWSKADAKIYSDIILENFLSLENAIKHLAEIGSAIQEARRRSCQQQLIRQRLEYIRGLNYCNTIINRIDSYFNVDQYRGPSNRNDHSKDQILSLQQEFSDYKKQFSKLSSEVSLYEDAIHLFLPNENQFEKETTRIVNQLVGTNFNNLFFTNFILEKSKLLEEKTDEHPEQKDTTGSENKQTNKSRWGNSYG